MVRRLPVLQTPPAGDDAEAEARPAWQWVLLGAAFVVVIFLPISVVGLWVGARVGHGVEGAAFVRALPVFLAFALAAASAGAFVGRFGRRAGSRSVALAGALGGAALVGLGALGGSLSPWTVAFAAAVVLVFAGCIFSLLGARLTRRSQKRR